MAEPKKRKIGLRYKMVSVIFFSALVIVIVGILGGYVVGVKLTYDLIGGERKQEAQLLARYVSYIVSGELEDVGTYVSRVLWIDAVKDANLKYQGKSSESIAKQLAELDREWIAAPPDSPLVKRYTQGNRINISIDEIVQTRKNIGELFITDKFGGLVAASGRTSDFYQADEDWWREAYAQGRGKVIIGKIEFDESSNAWSIPISAPIRDNDGNVIGILKELISNERFFGPLNLLQVGKTGRLLLADESGSVIFYQGVVPMSARLAYDVNFKNLLSGKKDYVVTDGILGNKEKILVTYAKIDQPLLGENKLFWNIFIMEDTSALFSPIYEMGIMLVLLMFFLILCIIPIGYIVGGIFVDPIHKLHLATERIMDGDWDYKFTVKTGDEIEQFADTFNEMIGQLKTRQEELLVAKVALEKLSQSLEIKVQERTEDLTRAQEATLNMLEDLNETKINLENYSRELEKALQVKSAFTSTVSHELRTPLASIKEGISLVLEGVSGEIAPQQREFLEIVKKNVDRLTRIINDILDFQKLDAGKMKFKMEECDINGIAEEVHKTLSSLTTQKNLEFSLKLSEGLPKVPADPDKITQALQNLVFNAIKFTEKGGIAIVTEKGDNFVKVCVSDTGCGIKPEDVPRLFTQFEQLDSGNERKTGGTGLGLVITKEIIEAHSGRVWVESEFGKGSNFCFILPVKERRIA